MSKLRKIKKYKNRLLYDTATSKLITLKQLAEMMRENTDIRIEDNESGKDITRLTILQMLLDLEKSGKGIRSLLPDLVTWVFNLPRLDLMKVLKELVRKKKHDKDFSRTWALKMIHETSLASLIPLDKEKKIVDELAAELNDLYEELLEALEQSMQNRLTLFDALFSPGMDSSRKSSSTTPEKE